MGSCTRKPCTINGFRVDTRVLNTPPAPASGNSYRWSAGLRRIRNSMEWKTNLLRTSRFCPYAYRAAVWCSRQNSRDVYGWLSRPDAETSYRCLESPPKTPGYYWRTYFHPPRSTFLLCISVVVCPQRSHRRSSILTLPSSPTVAHECLSPPRMKMVILGGGPCREEGRLILVPPACQQ